MRFFLRDIKNGHFLKKQRDWTKLLEEAQDFGSMEEAIAMAETLDSSDLEVFFEFGGIRLPILTPGAEPVVFKQKNP